MTQHRSAYREQRDIQAAKFTVRCDLPMPGSQETLVTVDTAGLAETLRSLATIADSLTWGEAPAIIEVRRLS